jgi:RHS repeat-associated protein
VSQTTPVGTDYYQFNAIGSTVGLTNSSGGLDDSYTYDPFGSILSSHVTIGNPFQFVGAQGVMADGNGLDFTRARFYDSSSGRFISPDPSGIAGGLNLYAYTSNQPLNHVDPSGLSFLSDAWQNGGCQVA